MSTAWPSRSSAGAGQSVCFFIAALGLDAR